MWMSKLLVAALCAQTSSAGWVYSGNTNAAEGDNAVVLGGDSNQASATNGLVGGGSANQVSEKATCAVIGGGGSNVNTGEYATVAAGRKNRAYSNYATVSGGYLNRASGRFAHVPGGSRNTAGGRYSMATGFNALALGDYSGALGFKADGSSPCLSRGDETLTICADTVDIQATLLIDGEELVTSRALAETNDDLRQEIAILKEDMLAMRKQLAQLMQ
eukprot:CAMPEP_0195514752 /NCGR_PEP_ID=MMETSP0794_2-20130614/6045_1 /TAXON_ID=515487 /ORGANISM="Stephanopyxis turris, Strain CCMP 815" /LENGTH=217 /DNA_ID=CAMNT_0040643061 /DNA_START=80 /DNA_END=733 /DNA_ORIENTATION=+